MTDFIFDWLWSLSPVVIVSVVLLALILALWGRRIAFHLFKGVITRKYALEAVRVSERFVFLLGKEKFLLAVQYLNNEIKKRFKFSLPDILLTKLVDWAYKKMVDNGEEIKAAEVLKIPKGQLGFDVKNLKIQPKKTGFEIQYHNKF